MHASIAVLEGDGIGPEIVAEAVKVLDAVAHRFGHRFDYRRTPFGAGAWFAHGAAFPAESKAVCDAADAILKGPAGVALADMRAIPVDQRPELAILELRQRYNTFANFRPVVLPRSLARLSPLRPDIVGDGIDILMIRELVGGIYFGEKVEGEHTQGSYASDDCHYSRVQIEQVSEVAFAEAAARDCHLTVVHKSNILATSRLWEEVVEELAPRFPAVDYSSILVDNAAFQLAVNPAQFNGVMLLDNMQGDILSDQAGGIVGSLGLMCSASAGPEKSYYEAVHGSAPDIAGRGVANPFSLIGSAALLLDKSFGLGAEAKAVWSALWDALETGRVTVDLASEGGPEALSTAEFGDVVAAGVLAYGHPDEADRADGAERDR
ncbi:MAG: isocitrate/isopropylmalate family dehydrogenase [Spirochaetaceae bacterium]|nr:isocitrate/isopropylmalate family dehydrogenase [Spirochaetaceae bacterium]